MLQVRDGVQQPVLLHKVEPEYSQAARNAGVQGTVILELVVNRAGEPTRITMISPLGFGLDENAIEAVNRWRFRPGTKGGQPVSVWATVEVNFRLLGRWYDSKAEKQRAAFNTALAIVNSASRQKADLAVKTLQNLAKEKYPPAMFLLGLLHLEGKWVDKDPSTAASLLLASADKNYGPALYVVGRMYRDGEHVPRDPERALKMWHDAATWGSAQAQFALGARYETGQEVPQDVARARRYFRLCAAAGEPLCQYRLAASLLELPDRREHDYLQALAWCQLAASKGVGEARQILEHEVPKLSAEQVKWVERLKTQLSRKP
jgi:TonB family protein